jgi:hypothetical protein
MTNTLAYYDEAYLSEAPKGGPLQGKALGTNVNKFVLSVNYGFFIIGQSVWKALPA